MSIVSVLIVVSVFVASEGNYFGDLFKCNDFLLKCQETEIIMGKFNRMTNELNRNCSQEIGSKWSNITRCEFEATKCLLNQINAMDANCDNIADIIHL
uniref:DUF19 domain-containing protein n=1 Tax=Drosophila melanogaster TaxID=7227 RepID=M9NFE3_DROME|nr:uncharacterized protein Dmel_CG43082 [Drosophila melanogaster]AFH04445.1 uncharacterized protein Dmel_CG43082 [Drosophila melanogaster]|eukprot:NP_001246774.1 uncharacterized protein Dmel_CG43082 [Drosophila melanogaster]